MSKDCSSTGTLWYDNITAVQDDPAQITITKASGAFADVPTSEWYYNAVAYPPTRP